jgi:hypothetical protein
MDVTMKSLLIFALALIALSAEAASPLFGQFDTNAFVAEPLAGYVRANTNSANPKALATKGDLDYAMALSNMVYRAAFDANGAATAATNASPFLLNRMSPPGGNNEYADMRTASNAYAGPALGVSYPGGNLGAWLWAANTNGLGASVWGIPINFPGGIQTFGNRYWQNLPKSPLSDPFSGEDHFIGMGPDASSFASAYINGPTNGPQQPVFNYIWGNPYVGAALLCIRGAFTNSIHGIFAGNTSNGVPVYISQFGLAIGLITDAYNPLEGGVATQRASDSQQVPSYQLGLGSDYSLDYYISLNGNRIGDHAEGGQIPLFAIQTTNLITTGDIDAGFPVQVANVWMIKQPAWKWALKVREKTGDVEVTNGTFHVDNILQKTTNAGSVVFGDRWDIAAPFNVNLSASFNAPFETLGYQAAWTFDAGAAHRMGFVSQQGEYTHLAHASGTPFIISQYSATDLHPMSASVVGTNEFTITPDGNVTIANDFTNLGNVSIGNGTSPKRLNIYDTFTDASNYRRLSLHHSGGSAFIDEDEAGTGTSTGDLNLRTVGSHGVRIWTANTVRWGFENDGLFEPIADNVYDIGTATRRARTNYSAYFTGSGQNLTSLMDTNIVVSTNNMSWPGPTNNLDFARGTLQRYHPSATTDINITNVLNFPANSAQSVNLWIENTNTSAVNVKLPAICEATNSLGGLTVSVNASNRLQILMTVTPSLAGMPGSTNALVSDQQLIK